MDALQHRLTQYKGSPGQGSTVKSALNVHHAEIKTLIALVATLQKRVAQLEAAWEPEPEPEALCVQAPDDLRHVVDREACAPILVVAALAPVVAAVIPVVAAAITSKPTAEATQPPPEVIGHYSVSAVPASSGNELPTPAAVQPASEEGSTDDSVEAILLEAEQHSADRFMSLAKHQQATTAKVRAAAARKRSATPHKKATP